MSAIIPAVGPLRDLDTKATPPEEVTEEQIQDASRMARLLMRILRDLAAIRRRFWPQTYDFEDIAVDATGTTLYRLPHSLNSRVRWWVTDWTGATAGPRLVRDATSDANTLILVSYTAGTATVRVEAGG